ncbi:MAG: tRNA 2-thiouridine(34) synthase MnmA [Pseudomonadota bacterium]
MTSLEHALEALEPLLPPAGTQVVVGVSGGVDSAVTALLLVRAGLSVHAVFMQNWEDDAADCTARQDYRDAAAVCAQLGIEIEALNFADEYWDRVFSHFLSEYKAGRTPNPDVLCNREIKFKAFLDHALARGAEAIATGHYAQRGTVDSAPALLRGTDQDKDQSYFLHALQSHQLAPALFPLGGMHKSDVRSLAHEAGLHVHNKKDSTGICFIGERHFNAFLSTYLPAQPGDIVTEAGETIGRHNGLMYYTLGQRRGIGVGGRADAATGAWFVADKHLDSNELLVVQGADHPLLMRRTMRLEQLSWCRARPETTELRCTAKIRYRQVDVPCTLVLDEDNTGQLVFDQAVRAATPGQSAVFYHDDECLGGGVIADFHSNVAGP